MTEISQKDISRRYKTIQQFQEKWEIEEYRLQTMCKHPEVVKKSCSDTGNYDKTADSYWDEFKCPDCGKWWSVEK